MNAPTASPRSPAAYAASSVNATFPPARQGAGPSSRSARAGDATTSATPITFVWLRHLTDPNAWASVGCVSSLGVGAVGIERLLPEGNPSFPAGFSARAWASPKFAQAVRKLNTWEPPICGPAPASGVTGAQEEQMFHPGGEALRTDGVGAEWVRYLAALHLHSARPCNHLEIDGRPLDVDAHPNARFWDSRIHWHTGVSTDRLGKPRSLTVEEASGFWGPDTQHFLTGTLVASARLTGSPACQWLLRNLATVYLLQRTLDGSTAGIFSAREVGYECLFAVACHESMEDRAMASRVVARCRSRMRNVVLPFIGQRDYVVAQIRTLPKLPAIELLLKAHGKLVQRSERGKPGEFDKMDRDQTLTEVEKLAAATGLRLVPKK